MSRTLLHYMVERCPVTDVEPVTEPEHVRKRKDALHAIREMSYRERRAGALRLARTLMADWRIISDVGSGRFRRAGGFLDRQEFLDNLFSSLMTSWQTARMIDWLDRRYELGLAACRERTGRW